MRVLYALLWKEGREILPKVLVGVALAVVVCLMRHHADFNRVFSENYLLTAPRGILVWMAIMLAMDAIARERSTGTLSFLLDKPVTGATVLAVKFF